MSIKIEYNFWAVGQGLFSNGVVKHSNAMKEFHWVYDCGTSSKAQLIDQSIFAMKKEYPVGEIDLLVISHFDKDHISGIKELAKQYKIKRVLLPYYSLGERLVLAYISGIKANNPLFDLYLNPVKFLTKSFYGETYHTEFLLFPTTNTSFEPREVKENEEGLIFQEIKPLSDEFTLGSNETIVKWLNPTRPLLFKIQGERVEFLPYNVPLKFLNKYPINMGKFINDVDNILKTGSPDFAQQLKKSYEKEFKGKGKSKDVNLISLHLYIRSLGKGLQNIAIKKGIYPATEVFETVANSNKNALVYTGDGFLNTAILWNEFENFLGKERVDDIFCFQVMHHGAEKNWQPHLASQIKPIISVFSADEQHKGYNHPSARVVKDFLPYNPILVNKKTMLRVIQR